MLPFRECHIVGIIQYVAFSDWLLSLSNMHLWFLPISSWLECLFLFLVHSLSCVWLFATPWRPQYTRLSCLLLSPRVCSNSCPLSHWWCHPIISSSVIHFLSCSQSFPASEYFSMSQLFASGGQSIGASSSTSVLAMNIQGWFHLGLSGLISLLYKGLSRVFSSTTVQKHQFFSAQLSLWSNSHFHIWLLEKPQLWLDRTWWQSDVSAFKYSV